MSAKKSWDIQSNLKKVRVEKRPTSVESTSLRPAVRAVLRKPAQKTPSRANDRLRDRRKKQRKTVLLVSALFFALVLAGFLYFFHLPAFRIQAVHAQGIHQTEIATAVTSQISGSYLHLIPKDSIFFFSSSAIRQSLLQQFPDIEALSISRDSLKSILIVPTDRSVAFLWCGTTRPVDGVQEVCYNTDSTGLLFALADERVAAATNSLASTTSLTIISSASPEGSNIRIYAELDTSAIASSTDPIRSMVVHADSIPGAIVFTKALGTLGARVTAIVIHQDEADLYVIGGTKITYVLGHEASAVALAQAVLPKITITDGSIEYIDLRFLGKAYVLRKGASTQSSISSDASFKQTATSTPKLVAPRTGTTTH